jgi:hypothetical protein
LQAELLARRSLCGGGEGGRRCDDVVR